MKAQPVAHLLHLGRSLQTIRQRRRSALLAPAQGLRVHRPGDHRPPVMPECRQIFDMNVLGLELDDRILPTAEIVHQIHGKSAQMIKGHAVGQFAGADAEKVIRPL